VPVGLVDDLRVDDRPDVVLPAGRLLGSVKVGCSVLAGDGRQWVIAVAHRNHPAALREG
jgi:hypothetical protein